MAADRILRSFGTHDGTFHADEVTACALLLLFDLIDRGSVTRSRSLDKLERCEFLCDVGGHYDPVEKRFDHHQAHYVGPLSSAGMVLLYLKQIGLLSSHAYAFFNHSLVKGVDDHDNGNAQTLDGVCTYSHIISNFNPIRYDAPIVEQESAFYIALDFAHQYLKKIWDRYRYIQSCRVTVEEVMKKADLVLMFDEELPWFDVFFELGGERHPALFLIMPSGKHWKLRGIPPSSHRKMEVRQPLPKAWAGLLEDSLKQVSGIPGAVFCHKGRFISVWESKEDALQALRYVIKERDHGHPFY